MNKPPSPGYQVINRRAFSRKAFRQTVTVIHATQTSQMQTSDISRDGICLLSPRPISPGSLCKVTFALPLVGGDTMVTAAVKVMYSSYTGPEGFKIGAAFSNLDAEAVDIIMTFVAMP